MISKKNETKYVGIQGSKQKIYFIVFIGMNVMNYNNPLNTVYRYLPENAFSVPLFIQPRLLPIFIISEI